MNDNFAGKCLRLPAGNSKGCFQVVHLCIATTGGYTFAIPVSTEVKQQNVIAMFILQGCDGPQVGAGNAVSMTEDYRGRWMRLRPEIPAQQFTVARMEEQGAPLRCGWFGFWMGQLPGEKGVI